MQAMQALNGINSRKTLIEEKSAKPTSLVFRNQTAESGGHIRNNLPSLPTKTIFSYVSTFRVTCKMNCVDGTALLPDQYIRETSTIILPIEEIRPGSKFIFT